MTGFKVLAWCSPCWQNAKNRAFLTNDASKIYACQLLSFSGAPTGTYRFPSTLHLAPAEPVVSGLFTECKIYIGW